MRYLFRKLVMLAGAYLFFFGLCVLAEAAEPMKLKLPWGVPENWAPTDAMQKVFVNAHDTLILSPPPMKMLSFCGIGKRAVAKRSNFL